MTTDTSAGPLALRPREAAKALCISTRTLWSITHPRGPIPCTRIGGRGGIVLYARADLEAWLNQHDEIASPTGGER